MFSDDLSHLDDEPVTLDHPDVATEQLTCVAVPEQWEGTLRDGRWFYFRYRFGQARLGVGWNLNTAVEDSYARPALPVDDDLSGVFVDQAVRARVFAELLGRIGTR